MTETTTEAITEAEPEAGPEDCAECGRTHQKLTFAGTAAAFSDGLDLVRDIATGEAYTGAQARARLNEVFSARGPEGAFWACLGISHAIHTKGGLRLPDSGEHDIMMFSSTFTDGEGEQREYLEGDPEYAAAVWAARFHRAAVDDDMERTAAIFASLTNEPVGEHGDTRRGMAIWALLGTAAMTIRLSDTKARAATIRKTELLASLFGLPGAEAKKGVRLIPDGVTADGAGITVSVEVGGGKDLGAAITELLSSLAETMREDKADATTEPAAGVRGPDHDAGPGDGGDGGSGEAPEGGARP